jgi:F-type H+-transporting ATPase subunit delta
MTTMRGASRQSFEAARRQLNSHLAGSDARAVARDLFAISRVLQGSAGLRRALTDPARDEESKVELATSLFGSQTSAGSLSIIRTLVAGRWSAPSEFSTSIELLAVEAESAAAESDGTLDRVEGELFQFARLLVNQSALRQAMTNRAVPVEAKQELAASLLAGKVSPSTQTLIAALIASSGGRSLERGLEEFAQVAARRRERSIARVTTAIELNDAQRSRLAAALAEQAGRAVQLNVEVDPSIIGGISVRLGDELLDGTIINRLADARRQIAG